VIFGVVVRIESKDALKRLKERTRMKVNGIFTDVCSAISNYDLQWGISARGFRH
jgi:hypothetical protein